MSFVTVPTPVPPAAQPEPGDKPLPITLPTVLRLAGGRPLIIAAARSVVELAAAELAHAPVDWMPNVYAGVGYYRHAGATQGQSDNFSNNTKDQFLAGGGATMEFATTDALFGPLAGRQVLRARASDVQTARHDALQLVADAYFNVQ